MRLLIIGCGGVGRVAIYKCCENPLFTEICIASLGNDAGIIGAAMLGKSYESGGILKNIFGGS